MRATQYRLTRGGWSASPDAPMTPGAARQGIWITSDPRDALGGVFEETGRALSLDDVATPWGAFAVRAQQWRNQGYSVSAGCFLTWAGLTRNNRRSLQMKDVRPIDMCTVECWMGAGAAMRISTYLSHYHCRSRAPHFGDGDQ